jgi:butyryl-CoA dehydrogenase
MDFGITDEQRTLLENVKKFSKEEIEPIAAEIDLKGIFPDDVIHKIGSMGLNGMIVSKELGGMGLDTVTYAMVIEELSRASASVSAAVSVNNSLVCYTLEKFGNEAQKMKFLVPLANGTKIGSFAVTEPTAGTDAASMQTTAKKEGDSYILNGTKIFITNAGKSKTALIFAMTDREKGVKGITSFIVDTSSKGYVVGKIEDKMGIRGSQQAQIFFENLAVPAENMLGKEGEGFKIAMSAIDCGRIGIAAQALGIAQSALDDSVKYAKERQQFGKPIGEFQAIQWKIAEMVTLTNAARFLVYRAAWKKDEGERFTMDASMAKLFASDVAMRVTREAVQVHGGHGYIKGSNVERLFRDAKITEIYEGTSEVQKIVISREALR